MHYADPTGLHDTLPAEGRHDAHFAALVSRLARAAFMHDGKMHIKHYVVLKGLLGQLKPFEHGIMHYAHGRHDSE